jgi:putative ABC transport system permease protein
MTARRLAWRTVAAEPARAWLAVAGITIIGALLFDMLMLSQGLLVSFRQMLDATGYDVRVVATDAFPERADITNASEVAAAIARLPEVHAVAIVRSEAATALVPNHTDADITIVNVSDGAEQQGWRIVAGVNLDAESSRRSEAPAVVSRTLARTLGISPGSTLRVRAEVPGARSAAPVTTLNVVGLAEFEFDNAGASTVATSSATFQRLRASTTGDPADAILVASSATHDARATAAAIARAQPEVRALSNDQIVDRFNENGFAYFRQISFVLTTITLGFAFLLVATLLTVSVNQRLGQVAALRALGLPRKRIAGTLVWESVLLVGGGSLLSLPVGWILAVRLDALLREMPNLPARLQFFIFEPRLAAVHLALLALTGFAAACYPVWVATRVPIAATLRLETV